MAEADMDYVSGLFDNPRSEPKANIAPDMDFVSGLFDNPPTPVAAKDPAPDMDYVSGLFDTKPQSPTPPAKGSPLYQGDVHIQPPRTPPSAPAAASVASNLSGDTIPPGGVQGPTLRNQLSDIAAMQMLNPAIAATPWGREFQRGAAESATPFGILQPTPLPKDASLVMKGSRMAGNIAGGVASFIIPGGTAKAILSKFPKYTSALNLLAKTNPKTAQIINGALHNIITFPIQHQMYMPIMTDVKTRLNGIMPSEIEAVKYTGANVIGMIPKVGKPLEAIAMFGIGYGNDDTVPRSERIINGAIMAGLGIFNMAGRGTYKPLTADQRSLMGSPAENQPSALELDLLQRSAGKDVNLPPRPISPEQLPLDIAQTSRQQAVTARAGEIGAEISKGGTRVYPQPVPTTPEEAILGGPRLPGTVDITATRPVTVAPPDAATPKSVAGVPKATLPELKSGKIVSELEATLKDAGLRAKDAKEVSEIVVKKIAEQKEAEAAREPITAGKKEISTIEKSLQRGVEVPYAEQAREKGTATYEPLSISESKERLAARSTADLEAESKVDTNPVTGEKVKPEERLLANMELSDRYEAAGNVEAANAAKDTVLKLASSSGQTLRTMAEWYKRNPNGMLSLLERMFAKKNAPLTARQSDALRPKIKGLTDAQGAVESAEIAHRTNPTAETKMALEEARINQETAWLDLANDVRGKTPRSVADTLWSLIQGNVLTPMSLMQNVYQNMLFAPVRGGISSVANAVDVGVSAATGQGRLVSATMGDRMRSVKRALVKARQVTKSLATKGDIADIAGDISTSDFRPTIKPVEAITKIFRRGGIQIPENIKGVQKASYVINTVLDALNPTAAFNFRMLALGDIPFRTYARSRDLYRAGREKGLTGEKLEAFVDAPPEKSFRDASESAKEDVFQKSNMMADTIGYIDKTIEADMGPMAPWAKLAYKSLTGMVFTLTPTNIIKQVGKLATPPISMATGLWRVAKSKQLYDQGKKVAANDMRRQGETDIAYSMIGSTIIGTAAYLANIGAISPTVSKSEKDRAMSYERKPPQKVNLSLIRRQAAGKNTSKEWLPGDEVISLTRLGIPGMVIGVMADMQDDMIKGMTPKKEGLAPAMNGTPDEAVGQYAISLGYTMLQNVSTLKGIQLTTDAMVNKDYKKWMGNIWELYSNIPVPNAWTQLKKSGEGYLVRTKDDDTLSTLKNRWAKKVGDYEGLPKVRNIWGDLVTEGTSPTDAYIDVAGWSTMAGSPETSFIWDIARSAPSQEMAANVIPPIPSRNFTLNGKSYKWSDQEYDRILAGVGQKRKEMVFNYMRGLNNETPLPLDAQYRKHARALQKIYASAAEMVEKPMMIDKQQQQRTP